MASAAMQPSSTMTTTSMTKTMTSTIPEDDESIKTMQANVIRYARGNDRRMVLRSLRGVKLLNCLLLDRGPAGGQVFDLEKEVSAEKLVLNGVPFKAATEDTDGRFQNSAAAEMRGSCIPFLKGLCAELCKGPDVKVSPREIYEKLIVRLAKTTSSADPYFRLNSLLGSPDLLVMPLNGENQHPSGSKPLAATGKSSAVLRSKGEAQTLEPSKLDMYESAGEIHIVLRESFEFGLFRRSDVATGRPWIVLETEVTERANLSNDNSTRFLSVKVPDFLY